MWEKKKWGTFCGGRTWPHWEGRESDMTQGISQPSSYKKMMVIECFIDTWAERIGWGSGLCCYPDFVLLWMDILGGGGFVKCNFTYKSSDLVFTLCTYRRLSVGLINAIHVMITLFVTLLANSANIFLIISLCSLPFITKRGPKKQKRKRNSWV